MPKKYSGLIFLLIAVLCWGPGPVVTKIALEEIPQLSFAFFGRIIALAIIIVPFLSKKYFKVKQKDLPMLVLAGLTGTFFNVGFFVFGIKYTDAMDAQAIFSTVPLITTIFAYLFLSEKIKRIQVAGVILGFLGVMLIASKHLFESGGLSVGNISGNVLIFMAAASFAVYILISRNLSHKYEPFTITCYSFIVSSVAFVPFAAFDFVSNPAWIADVGAKGLFGLFYIGVFASVIAFHSYQTGIKKTNAFTAGVILYLQPIITTIVASIVLGEKITKPFIIGAILIIAGSFIASQIKRFSRKEMGAQVS